MSQSTIQHLREARGESRAELAQTIGVSEETIVDWETGKAEPTTERIRRLVAHFGIAEHELDLQPGHDRSVFERIEDLF